MAPVADMLAVALLFAPVPIESGELPPVLQAALVRFAIGAGLVAPEELLHWDGWCDGRGVDWLGWWVRRVMAAPQIDELQRWPPPAVAAEWWTAGRRLEAILAKEIAHALTVQHERALRAELADTAWLRTVWGLVVEAQRGQWLATRRMALARLREMVPPLWWVDPARVPGLPYWRFPAD